MPESLKPSDEPFAPVTASPAKAPLIRLFVILTFVAGGGLLWSSARWLVGRDDIYLRWHDAGFGFVTDSASIVAWIGLGPSLSAGLILGTIIAMSLPGRGTQSDEFE